MRGAKVIVKGESGDLKMFALHEKSNAVTEKLIRRGGEEKLLNEFCVGLLNNQV